MELLWVQCGAVFGDHRPPSRLLALGEVCVESKQAQRATVVALLGLPRLGEVFAGPGGQLAVAEGGK